MARIRSIKPEFWTDSSIAKISKEAALFFISMWTFADDHGIIENDTRAMSLSVPSYRSQSIQGILSSLFKEGLIVLSEDSRLWLIVGWRHQKIDKRRPGKFNPSEIKWVRYEDAPTSRGAAPTIRRKDRIGEDPKGEERISSEGGKPSPETGGTIPTWESYRDAYQDRYGTAPVRNATVNGQLSNFVKRLGANEAPLVANFFLTHNDQFYLKAMHPVSLMLRDAEKLRTEWATGKKITGTLARGVESRDANAEVIRQYMLEKEEKRCKPTNESL